MKRAGLWVPAVVAALLLGAWFFSAKPRRNTEAGAAFAPTAAQVEAGRYLARAGNCIACHTEPGQPQYAGGRAVPTPFGNIYSSNLTPDRETGLGDWSAEDFWQAMHHGRGRDGRALYPAFPYTNYTKVRREDADAIFAYLRSLPPVRSEHRAAELGFPYNTGLAMTAWRALYFRPAVFEDDPARDAQWNRGAYLVEGLGHCNACHTTRDRLGGLQRAADYSGGPIPMLGWDALPLTSPQPMTDAQAAELARLLKTGVSEHSAVAGPMAEVVFHSLQHLHDADIEAMVAYLRSLPVADEPARPRVPQVSPADQKRLYAAGEGVYREHCSDCHGSEGRGKPYVYPALAGNPLVTSVSATNAIRTVLVGGYAPSTAGNPRPYGMPPYEHMLSDEQIAAVLTYVRNAWGNQAPAVSEIEVRRR